MKKVKLFILGFLLLFSNVLTVKAIDSGIKSLDDSFSISHDGIYFKNVNFNAYRYAETEQIGFMGNVENKNSGDILLNIDILFYDASKNLIGTDKKTITLGGKSIIYYNLHSLASELGYDSSNIKYYNFKFSVVSGTIDYIDNNDDNIIDDGDNDSNKIDADNNDVGDGNLDNDISGNIPSVDSVIHLSYPYFDYVIDKYDIDIKVNENNTYDVTETIVTYFNVPKHGIYRTLPINNLIERLDGTKSKNNAILTNVDVNDKFVVLREGNNYKIKIGSADTLLTGEKKYIISYNYNIGKDPLKGRDELYYNIIGTEWDTVIGNVNFKITMPKEFDSSKLGFSVGSFGSVDSENIIYNVTGNVIEGSYTGVLESGEGLTVRLELPDGYFVGIANSLDFSDYLFYIIPVLFLLISFMLWYKFGRDNKVVETIEYDVPSGLNSLEVGFLYKGKADRLDVISLLVYLANKGYIKITETSQQVLFFKIDGFKITKLKDYDGMNTNEKLFLDGLFANANQFDADNNLEVNCSDLCDKFYVTIDKILANINSRENQHKVFEKSASTKKKFIVLMIIATYFLITVPPFVHTYSTRNLLFALLFPGIGFSIMFSSVFSKSRILYVNGKVTKSHAVVKVFSFIWGIFFGGIPWLWFVFPVLKVNIVYLIGYLIGLVCIIGMIICLLYLPKRTVYGNQMLSKILGLKKFLETAEKSRLDSMMMYDPSYFYNIIPYAYVLDVSDKWISNFEFISVNAPDWYNNKDLFNARSFGNFFNKIMSSAQSVMSSPSSSSSSGGSSGGGSSGGGSGGGGGGSW